MQELSQSDFVRMERAITWLVQHAQEQPSLEEVAAQAGLSPAHFQRVFKRWAGVSPKRFVQLLSLESAKEALRAQQSVLEATLEASLSSQGRLHDLFVTLEAVTPGEFKRKGQGLEVSWGVAPSPFGACLVGQTGRGVCWLSFTQAPQEEQQALRQHWEGASLRRDDAGAQAVVASLFGPMRGSAPVQLLVKGTNFQVQVWRALLRLAPGEVCSYGELARRLGRPGASRAIGGAVGSNAVAVLIPCHRVLRASGALGGYRWGEPRKRALLAWEAARVEAGAAAPSEPQQGA